MFAGLPNEKRDGLTPVGGAVFCTERFVDAPSVVVLSIAVDETRRNEARSGERLRVSRDYGDFEGRWQPLEG